LGEEMRHRRKYYVQNNPIIAIATHILKIDSQLEKSKLSGGPIFASKELPRLQSYLHALYAEQAHRERLERRKRRDAKIETLEAEDKIKHSQKFFSFFRSEKWSPDLQVLHAAKKADNFGVGIKTDAPDQATALIWVEKIIQYEARVRAEIPYTQDIIDALAGC